MRRIPLHLIIVSYPSTLDTTLEEIALTLARGATEERVVERAQAPDDLVFQVRRWHLRERDVRRLDIVGHGAPGRMALGDVPLFGKGATTARALRPWLSPRATVRLLGCSVGAGAHPWLRDLATELGPGVRVLAPTRLFSPSDYRPDGLTAAARRALTSSTTKEAGPWRRRPSARPTTRRRRRPSR